MLDIEDLLPIEDPSHDRAPPELPRLPCSVGAVSDPETVGVPDHDDGGLDVTLPSPPLVGVLVSVARVLLIAVEVVGRELIDRDGRGDLRPSA